LHLAWDQDDRRVSDIMVKWWTHFARSGDPNGEDLPEWPRWDPDGDAKLMRINESASAEPETTRPRFEFYDQLESRKRADR
jgi:para-nitrobenzyl esterase